MFEIQCPVVNYSLSSIRAVVGNLRDKVVPAILGDVLGILVSVKPARENVRITHIHTHYFMNHIIQHSSSCHVVYKTIYKLHNLLKIFTAIEKKEQGSPIY